MANNNLHAAKKAKNDEFYTQWTDIEREMHAYLDYNPDVFRDKVILLPCDDPDWSNFTKFFALNFDAFGIKKLIATSYAPINNPTIAETYEPNDHEKQSPNFDPEKTLTHGKLYVIDRDVDANADGRINIDDTHMTYLEGNGDFRSAEVTTLRDQADIVITNPPFSLFRKFIAWLMEGNVQFSVIGNMNAITYKEVFPLIRDNQLWLGIGKPKIFETPLTAVEDKNQFLEDHIVYQKFGNICWFTNMQHGRRHEPLGVMTMEENLRFSRHKKILEEGYPTYDNYDAIEVGFTDAIPSDYGGIMGVPISFLDKYCPEQFEIVGSRRWAKTQVLLDAYTGSVNPPKNDKKTLINGKETYDRIFIRHLNPATN